MKLLKLLIAFTILSTLSFSNNKIIIRIPETSTRLKRDVYYIELLKLALSKSEVEFEIKLVDKIYNQKRIVDELSREDGRINLYWMGTSREFEEKMEPIRFPLIKGLLGYRIFIINKNKQEEFKLIKNLEDLQSLIGIQGEGWSDIEILEYSDLKQHELKYDNIFAVVNKGRVDYFSRGISEAFFEVNSSKENYSNLMVEENVLLVYPFAMLYFTNKNNYQLRDLIEQGLIQAYKDGSLDKLFYANPQIKEMFEKSNINSRVRIDIPNPLLSNEISEALKKYGYKQEQVSF